MLNVGVSNCLFNLNSTLHSFIILFYLHSLLYISSVSQISRLLSLLVISSLVMTAINFYVPVEACRTNIWSDVHIQIYVTIFCAYVIWFFADTDVTTGRPRTVRKRNALSQLHQESGEKVCKILNFSHPNRR